MILWFRWLITALVYHIGVGYASYLAIRNPSDIRTLKLCIIVGMLTMTSYALGDAISMVIPMFYEARALLIWGLLVVEPSGWNDLYDAVIGPVIHYVLGTSRVLSRSGISKRVLLWGVDAGTVVNSQAIRAAKMGGALKNPGRADMALGLIREEVISSKNELGPMPSLSNLYNNMSQYNQKKEVMIKKEEKEEAVLAATMKAKQDKEAAVVAANLAKQEEEARVAAAVEAYQEEVALAAAVKATQEEAALAAAIKAKQEEEAAFDAAIEEEEKKAVEESADGEVESQEFQL